MGALWPASILRAQQAFAMAIAMQSKLACQAVVAIYMDVYGHADHVYVVIISPSKTELHLLERGPFSIPECCSLLLQNGDQAASQWARTDISATA